MPGENLPDLKHSQRGELVMEVQLMTPDNLTPRQEELLKEFLRLEDLGETNGLP